MRREVYESKPRRREGEPIELLVGEAIELTASRAGSGPETDADGGEIGRGEQVGEEQGLRAGGARDGWMGRVPRLPWDGWDRERLRAALLVAVAAAAGEALALIAVLVAAIV